MEQSGIVPVDMELVVAFKGAMRRLTSTVALLTAEQDGRRFGMTVTAVCSLGISPPTLIVSIGHAASMHDVVIATGRIGVNLLREAHHELVADFAGRKKGEARFEVGDWIADANGLPILADAQASLSCRVARRIEYSGHSVFFIAVESVRLSEHIEPLLYQNGNVARSAPLAVA